MSDGVGQCWPDAEAKSMLKRRPEGSVKSKV
jgi:hypothetical protein